MDNAKSNIIIGSTFFLGGSILILLSSDSIGNNRIGIFSVLVIAGLVILIKGVATKAKVSTSSETELTSALFSQKPVSEARQSLTFTNLDDLVIIKIGAYYNVADYEFFWYVIKDPAETGAERQKIFKPNQAILDFSSNTSFDSYGYEFCQLIEQYEVVKGKKIIIVGVKEHLKEIYFQLDGKNFLDDSLTFNTVEEAISFYKNQNLNSN